MPRSLLIIFIILPGLLFAQYGVNGITDARSIALGSSYVTSSYGLNSVGKNPSLLANTGHEGSQVRFMFPKITAASLNLGDAGELFGKLFSGNMNETISGLTSEKLKAAFDGDGRIQLTGALDFISLGYQPSSKVGIFGITTTEYISTYLKLPGVLVDFSNDESIEGEFSLNDFEFSTWWIRSYALSYARRFETAPDDGIECIYAGVSLKYFEGYAYTQIYMDGGFSLSTSDLFFRGRYRAEINSAFSSNIKQGTIFDTLKATFRYPFLSPSGKGLGFDIGATLVFEKGITLAISATDIGSINWKKNVARHEIEGVIDIDKDVTIKEIRSLFDSIYINREDLQPFRTPTPTAFRFGIAFKLDKMMDKFPGHLMLVADFNNPLNSAPGNSNYIRLSAGLEYYYNNKWPIFMTGVTYGRLKNALLSLGLGYRLNFLHIYISTANLPALFEEHIPVSLSASLNWILSGKKKQ
jgi:hypothetical protein